MSNPTQIERYQKLLEFLDKQFKSSISSKDIEEVSFIPIEILIEYFMLFNRKLLVITLKE